MAGRPPGYPSGQIHRLCQVTLPTPQLTPSPPPLTLQAPAPTSSFQYQQPSRQALQSNGRSLCKLQEEMKTPGLIQATTKAHVLPGETWPRSAPSIPAAGLCSSQLPPTCAHAPTVRLHTPYFSAGTQGPPLLCTNLVPSVGLHPFSPARSIKQRPECLLQKPSLPALLSSQSSSLRPSLPGT